MDKEFIVKSLLTGFLIGPECLVYIVCPNKIVGAFLFSLGLISIIIKQFNLYTGKVGYFSKSSAYLLLPMFLFNAIGVGITCWLFSFTRLDLSAVIPLVATKLKDSYHSIFPLAIGCGVTMHLAVDNYKRCNRNPLMVIMPIMFFICCGFEHCVANVGYIAMAHTPVTIDLICRVATMVAGNAIGSFLVSKFVQPKTTS